MLKEFKEEMMKTFEMSDLGELKYILGLEVKNLNDGLFVSQHKYAANLLNKFGMENCNSATTPMNTNEHLQLHDDSENVCSTKYRRIVGGLLYLTHTKPDLMFAVSTVSRFMSSPSSHHYGALKRILRYVKGTLNYGLFYKTIGGLELQGHSDSDWGGSIDDRRSTSGWCFSLRSAVIAWSSKKQTIAALSSTEAEYITLTSAACEAVWLRRLMNDLYEKQTSASVIYCDSNQPFKLLETQYIMEEQNILTPVITSSEI
ncbi:uncharacterized mitochondrial protein AtMg00810-like [Dioscorea cayenensis subsp. rotundata]|uniref:Uncharacterized mitochondrial protein AtMg00810-like n=1 Tax=Dioscorea cayennensis subsp. rotundata TaxID=55577 RepID=A0AB40B365_DIOCR|nr:uncharacterized mitochondrial protein AtMg00810-like [Dioscorea cayenensis subsp. rotundata]